MKETVTGIVSGKERETERGTEEDQGIDVPWIETGNESEKGKEIVNEKGKGRDTG